MSWITIFVIFIIILIIYKLCMPSSKLRYYGDLIPGPKAYPLIGNGLVFLTSKPVLHVLMDLGQIYGEIFRLWLGKQLFVILSDPADIEVFLSNTKNLDKTDSYRFLDSWLGNTNLLTSDGDIWQVHRKLLTPSFHFKILESTVPMITRNANILCEKLEEQIDKPDFRMDSYIEKCSLDIICETAMGVKLETQKSNNTVYLDCVKRVGEALMKRIFLPWLHPEPLFKISKEGKLYFSNLQIIKAEGQKVISERRNMLEENEKIFLEAEREGKKPLRPFLDYLLSESGFTDKEIENEVQAFMFAGHDTTKAAISFCLYVLSSHPDVQEKIVNEAKEILLDREEPTYQDLLNMKYLECVIKESMRHYSPVPIYSRKVREDIRMPSGYILPAGTLVNFNVFRMHRNEKYFSNSDSFQPERFESRENIRNSFAFVPFSAGPRNCIGQKFAMLEMKAVLCNVMLKYRILPPLTADPPALEVSLVLRSLNNLYVRIKRR